jgi:branched-chain amino acid transport system permease protein
MFWLKRILSIALGIGACFLIDRFAHSRDDYTLRLIVLSGLYVTLAVSLNLINGITGQFSIGHAAFYQVGAYLAGFTTVTYFQNQRGMAGPGWIVALAGLVMAIFGAAVFVSPEEKSDKIKFVSNLLALLGVLVFVGSWFVNVPFEPYIILGLFAVALWFRTPPESAKSTAKWGAFILAFGALFYLFFSFGPKLPELPWLIVMVVIGSVGAAVAGLVVGLPSLRLKGDYLAIVTMGFGEIIRIEVQNSKALGGSYGMNITPKIQPVWLVWLLAFSCIALCRNLIKTAHGLPFLSVREDEVASSAMGVNVTRVKVTAFVIGSMFAGGAGALLAHYEGFITGATFAMDTSFIILTMVVLGGTGSITGSVVSAILLAYLPEYLRGLKGADGAALMVSGASVLAGLLAVVVAVAIIKRVMDHVYKPKPIKAAMYVGALVAALVSKIVFGILINKVASLRDMMIQAGQLRMVVFAVVLIVLMLLRPQGMFANSEFGWGVLEGPWSWLKAYVWTRFRLNAQKAGALLVGGLILVGYAFVRLNSLQSQIGSVVTHRNDWLAFGILGIGSVVSIIGVVSLIAALGGRGGSRI